MSETTGYEAEFRTVVEQVKVLPHEQIPGMVTGQLHPPGPLALDLFLYPLIINPGPLGAVDIRIVPHHFIQLVHFRQTSAQWARGGR